MQRPNNLKVGDRFRVIERNNYFNVGEIISLKDDDDGSTNPYFWSEDKSYFWCISFSDLEPHTKSVRDAQVGDVVEDSNAARCVVFERGQSTVLLSRKNDFTKTGDTFTFDELDRYFTLKAEPEVVDDKIAEAILKDGKTYRIKILEEIK